MSRGRQKSGELEELGSGLGQAADPFMIADLMPLDVEQLAEMANAEVKYTAISMIRAGRIFRAIKKKLGHNKWEGFVEKKRWPWNYVHASMRFIEVVAHFPQAIHLSPGNATKNLLRLPMPQIEEVLRELPSEAVKKLTIGDLEAIHRKEKENHKRATPAKPPKDLPDVIPTVERVDSLVAEVEGLLRELAELDLSKSTSRDKFADYLLHLSATFDHARYNLRDPDHTKKPWWQMDPMHDDISEDS